MKAQGIPVGASLVDNSLLQYSKKLIAHAATTQTKLVLPTDIQVAEKSFDGPLVNKSCSSIQENDYGIALGPQSTTLYASEIGTAKTIFFNAAMGFSQRPETMLATKKLIESIGASSAYGVIGGGDSVACAKTYSQGNGIRHLSTGGGATIAYISGLPLPGLKALCATK
jgi:phosphoglycerate kinase